MKSGYDPDEFKKAIIDKYGEKSVRVMTKNEWLEDEKRISEQSAHSSSL